jgi:hypothetical protein
MPIIPPSIAFIAAITEINGLFMLGQKNIKIERGASFCQEDRIVHEVHDTEDITDGYQKWHGTLPIFSKIEIISILGTKFSIFENGVHNSIEKDKSMADPSACARKYLIHPSVSWCDFENIIIGINLNMLSSMAAHMNIQLVLDIAITVLIIRVLAVRIDVGAHKYLIRL